MHLRIPVWLLCFMYVSCIKYGEEKELVNRTEEDTFCNITITHRSASYLKTMFNKIDPDVAHFKLKFLESLVVNAEKEAIQPFRWIWTFQSEGWNVPFLQWDLDYEALSFGLLNAKALPETLVEFDVQPPNCSITIGNRKSNLEIAYAFSNMTYKYLNSMNIQYVDNRKHSWCFAAEYKNSYKYNCCHSYYDFFNEKINVHCSDDLLQDELTSSKIVLFILGYIVFCYFPIPLLDIISNMSGRRVCNSQLSLSDDLTSDIVYLDKHSPITLSSIIYESFYKPHPQIASRVCGVIFIICFPGLIYTQLILYYIIMKDTTLELINHGKTMSFLTMLGGYERSRELFMPYLGGPYFIIVLFCLIGIAFVLLPHKPIGNMIEKEIIIHEQDDTGLISLGDNSWQLFSHIKIEEECVYGRLKSVMIARCLCILNPTFVRHVCRVCFNGWKRGLTYLRKKLPMPLYYCLSVIIFPISFLVLIMVISLYFLYYGLPFHFLWFTSFFALYKPLILWLLDLSCVMRKESCVLLIVLTCVMSVFVLFYVYFFISMILIFCFSFVFIFQVLLFLFIAVFVYPSTSFVYVSLVIVLLYYLFKQLRGIGDVYSCLLSDIVKSISVLKDESNELRVVVSYKDRMPGIPRELFLYVVKKHRPIFLSVFKAILPFVLVIVLMPVTIQITTFTSNDASTITEVMKVIFIVLIGTLPRAVEIALFDSNKPVLKDIFVKTLEATILEYSKRLVETQSSDNPGLENVS